MHACQIFEITVIFFLMFISSISNKMSLFLDYQCQNLIRDIESKVVCLATTVKKMEAMEPNNPNLRLINSNLLEIEFYKKPLASISCPSRCLFWLKIYWLLHRKIRILYQFWTYCWIVLFHMLLVLIILVYEL